MKAFGELIFIGGIIGLCIVFPPLILVLLVLLGLILMGVSNG